MNSDEANALLEEIRKAAPVESRGKVLIACRTQYFLNRPDEKTKVVGGALRRTRGGRSEGDFRIVYLQPFDEERILKYLHNLFPTRAKEILGFLQNVHNLMDLAQRPFLLFLITESLDELEKKAGAGQSISAADIYQTVVAAWLQRDEGKHHIFPEIKLAFMEMLAVVLWREKVRRLGFAKLRNWFQHNLPEQLPAMQLRDLDRFDTEMRTTAFLSRDAEGNYGFAHTSFQEFFLALALAKGLDAGELTKLDLPRLNQETIAFILDLLSQPTAAANHIAQLLETKYQPQISENCFLLTLAWQAAIPESAPTPTSWQLQGADLQGVDLSKQTLVGIDFSGANLQKVFLNGAKIRGSFAGSDLTESKGRDADFRQCDFSDSNIIGADLAGASMDGADFSRAQISCGNMQRSTLTGADFKRAKINMVAMGGAKVSKKQLAEATLTHISQPKNSLPPPPF